MKTGFLAEPILVGRERELEELRRCLDLAIEGKGSTVFVTGEAGSGKTRLVNEFMKQAREKGALVLAGWCLSNATVPYFPFAVAFDPYFSSGLDTNFSTQPLGIKTGLNQPEPNATGVSGMATWLSAPQQPDRTGKPSVMTPQVWKDQAFAAVVRTLHTISAQEPVVLFIEDIHWADSASLSLLHFISRTAASERIVVLATFRSEELTADSEGHPHPLAEEMRLMQREDLFTEMRLSHLDREVVSKIAENMVGGKLDPGLAARLAEESRGNALFLVETLRMLSEQKSIVQEDNQWRLAIEDFGIPSKIRDIILRRLAVLKSSQRRVLDAASVIGEKFDVELLGAVLGQDCLEVLETLNLVAQSTSLVVVEENYFRFNHAKSQETLYEEIPLPLKRGYHARVAEKLETTCRDAKLPFSDLAYHYAQAGNKEKAAKYALAAGQNALARFSNTEAVKHFEYVLRTIPEAPESAEARSIALEGLGDAYFATYKFQESLEVIERLAALRTDRIRLRALRKAMDAIFWKQQPKGGESDRLFELVGKAEPFAAFDRLESARVRFFRGAAYTLSKSVELALKDYEEALRVFEEEYSLPDIARALEPLAANRSDEKGLIMALRSIALFDELGDLRGSIRPTELAGLSFFGLGLLNEALEKRVRTTEIGEKIGDYRKMAQAVLYQAQLEDRLRPGGDTLPKVEKAAECSQKADVTSIQTEIYAYFVMQYARLGDIQHAREFFMKLENLHHETTADVFESWLFNLAEAVFSAARNQWGEAYRCFEKAFKNPISLIMNRSLEMIAREHYSWALEKQGRADEAKAQRMEIQKYLEEAAQKYSRVRLDASLLAPWKVVAGEEFEMRLDLVNVSRKPGLLVRAKDLLPPELMVTSHPADYSLENGAVEMKERTLGPFQVEIIKLRVKPSKPGVFTLNPEVLYIDELNETKTCKPKPITITVQPVQPKYEVLPGRIPTGFAELDALLFGGIPQKYAVVLSSPSAGEREQLTKRFLETGVTARETTFHITTEAENTKILAEKYPSNFYLFVCNPQADTIIQNKSNIFKLKGIENLTDIDIALTKAFRALDPSGVGLGRICIDIVSDVLLQHHAITTRRWLSALLPTLKSKGFTTLATINPRMHLPEEFEAVLGLFDGEIRVSEKETPEGTRQTLKIRKLGNQKYQENELILNKEKLEQQ